MRRKFTQEAPLGIITLVVCLPVAAVLAYVIAHYYADGLGDFVRRSPAEIVLTIAAVAMCVGVIVYRFRKARG